MLVEGPTERAVVQRMIAPYLGAKGVYLYPRVIGKPGRKGGVPRFEVLIREIRALWRQEPGKAITTFFDYYGLSSDWPGKIEAKDKTGDEIPEIVEAAIKSEILSRLDEIARPNLLIPYIQMFELEALLFAGPGEMAEVFERPDLAVRFEEMVSACGGCEKIDDNPAIAPSKRIMALFPRYRKGSGVNAHAPIICGRIGVDRLRHACPHFDCWLSRLEKL